MSTNRRSRSPLPLLTVLAVVLVLGAARPASAASPVPESGLGHTLWTRLWASVSALWGQASCIEDPNGRCLDGSAPQGGVVEGGRGGGLWAQGGCIMDPNGRCREGTSPLADPDATRRSDTGNP